MVLCCKEQKKKKRGSPDEKSAVLLEVAENRGSLGEKFRCAEERNLHLVADKPILKPPIPLYNVEVHSSITTAVYIHRF